MSHSPKACVWVIDELVSLNWCKCHDVWLVIYLSGHIGEKKNV